MRACRIVPVAPGCEAQNPPDPGNARTKTSERIYIRIYKSLIINNLQLVEKRTCACAPRRVSWAAFSGDNT